MAAPQVSAVAGNCLVLHPGLDAARLQALLAVTADKSPAFEGVVRAGGIVSSLRACRLAAVASCIARGEQLAAAATKLGVPPDEMDRLAADYATIFTRRQ